MASTREIRRTFQEATFANDRLGVRVFFFMHLDIAKSEPRGRKASREEVQ